MSNTRTVITWASKGGKQKYETDAKTWGELKSLVEQHYDLSNLVATENTNKTSLEHPDAVLPEGDFKLFFRQVKAKSGLNVEGLKFKELRALGEKHGAKDYLNSYVKGKNWTQLTTNELAEALAKFEVKGESKKSAKVEEVQVTEVQENTTCCANPETNSLDKALQVKATLQAICEKEGGETCERVELIIDEIDGLISILEEVYSSDALAAKRKADEEEAKRKAEEEAQKEADRRETEELQNEANEFLKEF